jgi:hypothetical protein
MSGPGPLAGPEIPWNEKTLPKIEHKAYIRAVHDVQLLELRHIRRSDPDHPEEL